MIEIVGLAVYHQSGSHRTAWFPGMALDNAPQEVQDAAAGLWTPEAVAQWQQDNQGDAGLTPPPAFSAGWAELIVSPLYQRALQLAFSSLPVNTAMTLFGMAYQAHRDLAHSVWASALSASAGHLAMAINASPFPLTTEEMDWIVEWSERNHLGLTFPWEGTNG